MFFLFLQAKEIANILPPELADYDVNDVKRYGGYHKRNGKVEGVGRYVLFSVLKEYFLISLKYVAVISNELMNV